MNKIYKLIWSKVKNMWVVASELAKNHTKSPKSGIVGSVSLASLESKINMDLSKGFVAGVFPMVNRPVAKLSDFKITVAAIVKNEAENVPTWVQAARSCADEIVVVDTGSTDDTVERFADYGIKCFHYDWHDDFASAKNYMISLCHGDWIVLLDGDEWFREGCDVRKAIAKHHGNPITKAIIADWICLDKDRGNAVMFSGGAVRAFRNQPDVRYFRKVHENLTINYENFAFEPEFKMYHTGYSGSVNRSKHERNLRIMRTMFDFDNGKVEYPTDWRYIEDTYAGLGQFDKALWAADQMIRYGVQEYSAAAWITKFNVLFAMKTPLAEMRKQFDFCFRTVPSVSGFRFLASIYYIRNGLMEEGLDNYIEGLRMLMGPQDKVAMEHTYWRMYMPEASALASTVYLQNKQVEASLYACKVCEQYCGKNNWTDMALSDVRRLMNTEDVSVNIADRLLPVLNFSKKAVLATALVSSLTVGMVNDVYAASCVVGGENNRATCDYTVAVGGRCNYATACYASVIGGACGTASGNQSTVVGGYLNKASGGSSLIAGGNTNTASGGSSVASGGKCNTASGQFSVAVGGYCNLTATIGCYSVVIGGCFGITYACYSTAIGGGITGVSSCNQTALGSVAIGSGAMTTRDYEVVIGSACAPVKIDGALTVDGAKMVTDGTTTKTWSQLLNASGGGSSGSGTDTNSVTHLYAGSGTAANATTTNGNTKITVADDATVRNSITIIGTGGTTVTSDANGVITIDSASGGATAVCFADGVVLAGCSNTASGCYSSVSGGCGNIASCDYSSVSGGNCNTASCSYSSVSGGRQNLSRGLYSSVSGGQCNTASGLSSSVSGGCCNTASGCYSSISGGCGNIASGYATSVSGGYKNTASYSYSSVSGGQCNTASGYASSAIGGCNGFAYACYSIVIGGGIAGVSTCAKTALGSIAIGKCATTTRDYEVAIGSACAPVTIGGNMTVTGTQTVTDGTNTKTWTELLTASGGGGGGTGTNSVTHLYAGNGTAANATTTNGNTKITVADDTTVRDSITIKGTGGTTVTSDANGVITINSASGGATAVCFADGVVLAGCTNTASGCYSSVSGGECNTASGCSATVSGGDYNKATNSWSSVAGGYLNTASGCHSSVIGGTQNKASGCYSSVVGGLVNIASCYSAVVIGGCCNTANGDSTLVVGGWCNTASGSLASAIGGCCGIAYAKGSTVIGGGITGVSTCADTAQYSVAIGKGAKTTSNYQVAIGSASAPVKIGGNLTVTGTNTVTDGTTTKTWSQLLNASGGSGGADLSGLQLFAGSGSAANASTSNGNTKISLANDSSVLNSLTIKGTGTTTVTSDANGVITINSTDANTTYSAGNGVSLSGTTFSAKPYNGITVDSNGIGVKAGTNVTVNSNGVSVTGSGSVASGNTGLISGGTLFTEGRITADGTFAKKANSIATNITALDTAAKNAIKGLSVSGTTITYTKGDGSTGTITTQDNNTTYLAFTGATSSAAGTAGLVKAPAAGDQDKFLRGDGTWAVDNDTKYTAMTASEATTGTGTTARSITAKVLADYVGGKVTDAKNGMITDLSISGKTITYTKGDGTTGTLTTQDNNTTYSAGAGLSLSGTTFSVNTNGSIASGNTGVLNGGTVYSEVRPTADGTFAKKANTTAANITALDTAAKNAIKGLSVSGTTITYTKGDGTTGTITTQDNNTTYTNMSASELSTGTATTARSISAKVIADYVTGKVSAETTARNTAISSEATARADADTALDVRVDESIKGLSVSGKTITYTKGDGTTGTITTQDTNTTYTAGNGIALSGTTFSAKAGTNVSVDSNGINVVGNGSVASGNTGLVSGGTLFTENRITADGTFAKKANTTAANITALDTAAKNAIKELSVSGQTITYTKGDGTTGTITTQDTNTDTKVTNTLGTTTKAYLTGTTSATTNTGSQIFDTGVYLDTTAGKLHVGSLESGGAISGMTGTFSGNITAATPTAGDSSTKVATTAFVGNAIDTAEADSIKGLSVSGRTITYTKGDGTTGTITTQDNNTTYDNMSATELSTGTATTARSISAKTIADYVTGKVSAETTARTSAVSSEATARANADTALGTRIDGTIKDLSVSGRTITYTKGDGTIGTITTQDNNTTYDAMSASELSTGTATTARTVTAKVLGDYVTGKVSAETTARTTAINSEATTRANADTALGTRIDNAITAYESADTALSNRIGSLSVDGNYIKKSATNNVSVNLTALDTQLKTTTTAVSTETTNRTNADTALSNRIGSVVSDGTFIKKSATNDVAANLTALDTAAKNAIKGLSVSGTTITYTKGDGTTGTITTQDNNTTYDNMTASELSTGTATTARSISAKVLADYVAGKVSDESSARTTAINTEASTRQSADTALGTRIDNAITSYESADTGLSNRIGTLSADGNYIKKSATNNVSANLTALDTQLKATTTAVSTETTNRTNADTALGTRIDTEVSNRTSADTALDNKITAETAARESAISGLQNSISSLSGNAVQYDDGNKNLITLEGTNGTVISNVKAGTLSANSTEAVNGSQLYATNQAIATEVTNRSNAVSGEATTRANADTALGTRIDNVIAAYESADTSLSNRIGSLSADGNYIKKSATNNVSANLTALDTQLKATTTALGTETTNRSNADTDLSNRIGTVSADGNYIKKSTTKNIAENLGLLDTQVKANATAIATEVTNRTNAVSGEATARSDADTALSNRIDALSGNTVHYDGDSNVMVTLEGNGGTTISNVKSGTLSAASTEAVNGSQLYTTNQNLAQEITNRANEDTALSNRIGTLSANGNYIMVSNDVLANVKVLDTKIGTASSANGTYTKTANTVNANIKALDTQLKTVTDDKANKDASNVSDYAGQWGVAVGTGKIEVNNTQLVTGGTVWSALQSMANKADKNASNISSTDAANWGNAIGLGQITSDESRLVTGKTVYDEVRPSVDKNYVKKSYTTSQNLEALDTQLKIVTDGLASGLSDSSSAIAAEAVARENADTALSDRIGILNANGNYILKNNNVSGNLSSLDAQLKVVTDGLAAEVTNRSNAVSGESQARSNADTALGNRIDSLDGVAVKYDTTAKSRISLEGTAGTTIDNVKDGILSADSKEAVNGSQLYSTNQALAQEVTNRTNAVADEISARQTADNALGARIDTEIADRQTAVSNEATARSNADTALGVRIDNEITARENAISQLSQDIITLGGNAVQYDGTDKSKVTLDGTNGTTIDNVKAGTLSVNSKEVVNGSQLYSTNQALAQEVTNRTNAIADEVSARQTADAALGVRIDDEIMARENAISQLSQNITTLGGNAVQYDGADKSKVTLGGTNGTTIDNVKAGTLSANSKEAVNGSQLYSTNQALAQEISDRQTAVTAESTARESADTALGVRIDTEASSRESADTALGARVDTEIADRQTAVSNEAMARSNADAALGNRIDTEITNRTNADSVLDDKITAEITARESAVSSLQNSISSLSGNAVQYDGADKNKITLEGTGGTVIRNVKAGTLSGTSMEAVNGSQLYATNQAISTEVSNRTSADTALGTRIDHVISDYQAADAALDNRIGTQTANGNYIKKSGTNNVVANIAVLDTQLKSTNDNLAQEVTDRATAVNTEKTARENADTALSERIGTVASDGYYIKKSGTNDVAQNLMVLDTKLKATADSLGTLDGLAVQYDAANQSKVTLGGSNGTTIDNVKEGILSASSKEAVNGSQLFKTNQDLATEIRERTMAVNTEKTARENADAVLGDRIGAISADGNYIKNSSSKNLSQNLSLLDSQIKVNSDAIGNLEELSVQYDSGTKDNIILAGAAGTTIHNVKAGTLSSISKEAVNGSQLYTTNQALAQEISDRQTAVSVESTARESADTALGVRIDTEASSRESADTALGARVDTQIADRQTAVSNEATARSDADAALGVRIDNEITARENAISQLSQDITTLGGNAVQYDGTDKSKVTLDGTNGTTIDNVKDGTLSVTSKEAVNGSQLYQTNQNLAQEATDRINVVNMEKTTRETADTVLSNRIGTISIDGTYIKNSNEHDVSENIGVLDRNLSRVDSALTQEIQDRISAVNTEKTAREVADTALDNRITALSDNVIHYDDASMSKVTLAGVGGTTVDNVKAGTLSADSKEAVNGSQLYTTNQNLSTEIQDRTNADTALNQKIDTEISNRVTAVSSEASVRMADDILLSDRIGVVDSDQNYIKKSDTNSVSDNLVILDQQLKTTDTNLRTEITERVNAVNAEKTARETADTALSDRIGTLGQNGSYVLATNNVLQNVSLLDVGLKAEKDAREADVRTLTEVVSGLGSNAVLYDNLSKGRITLSGAGGTVIDKVRGGSLSPDSMEAVNGSQLYSTNVNVSNEIAARQEADTALDGKISNEASIRENAVAGLNDRIAAEVSDRQTAVTDEKNTRETADTALGNRIDSEIVNRTNADSVLDDKINAEISARENAMGQLTDAIGELGDTVLHYDNPIHTRITFAGENGTVLDNVKAGKLSANSKEAVNGSQLFTTNQALAEKVNVDASNVGVNAVTDNSEAWASAIGTGAVTSGNRKLVTGGMVYDAIEARFGQVNVSDTTSGAVAVGDGSTVNGNHSVAVGDGSTVNGQNSTAIGSGSEVTGNNAVGLGNHTTADGQGATAIGTGSSAEGQNTTVVGGNSSVEGIGSTVVGSSTDVTGDNAVGIGTEATVNGTGSVAVGSGSSVNGEGSSAIGLNTMVTGDNGSAFGSSSAASGTGATAIGHESSAVGDSSVALGEHSVAKEDDVISVGHKATDTNAQGQAFGSDLTRRIVNVAEGASATDVATVSQTAAFENSDTADIVSTGTNAIGQSKYKVNVKKDGVVEEGNTNLVTGGTVYDAINERIGAINISSNVSEGTAFGEGATVSSDGGTAVGDNSQAGGKDAVAVGQGTSATGEGSTAIGTGSTSEGDGAIALGNEAASNGEGAVTIGNDSSSTGVGTTVVGTGATVEGNSSTAIGSGSSVDATDAVAVGAGSSVTGDSSTAVGVSSSASAAGTSAFGNNAEASGSNATALGTNTVVDSDNAVAVGHDAVVNAEGGVGLGSNTSVTGTNSVALGTDSVATDSDVISLGHKATDTDVNGNAYGSDLARRIVNVAEGTSASDVATVSQTTAFVNNEYVTFVQDGTNDIGQKQYKLNIVTDGVVEEGNSGIVTGGTVYNALKNLGSGTTGSGTNGSTAIGEGSSTTDNNSVAIGGNSTASGENTVAVGTGSSVEGQNSSAVGTNADVTGDNSVGFGNDVSVEGTGSVAVGGGATVEGQNSTAVGTNAEVTGDNAVGLGNDTSVQGAGAVGIGSGSTVAGEGSVALGSDTLVTGTNGFAVGTNSVSSGNGASAVGHGAIAEGNSSVALGENSVASDDNVISLGHTATDTDVQGQAYGSDLTRRIINVADGVNATDAATVRQVREYVGGSRTTLTADGQNALGQDRYVMDVKVDGQIASGNTGLVTGGAIYDAIRNVSSIGGGTVESGTQDAIAVGNNSTVSGDNSVSVGTGSTVEGQNSTAVGTNSEVTGDNSIGLGNDTTVSGTDSVAVGGGASVEGQGATAVGTNSEVTGDNAVGVGNDTTVAGAGAIAIGSGSVVNGEGSVAFGSDTAVTGSNGSAIGNSSVSSGDGATAVGHNANAEGDSSVALGEESVAKEDDVISVGHKATDTDVNGNAYGSDLSRRIVNVAEGTSASDVATVSQTTAFVNNEYATFVQDGTNDIGQKQYKLNIVTDGVVEEGNSGIVTGGTVYNALKNLGSGTTGSGTNGSTAIGEGSSTTDDNSVAIGGNSTASGENTVAVGTGSSVEGQNSSAVGTNADVTGDNSVGFGNDTSVEGTGSVAVGGGATVEGRNSTVIGSNSEVRADDSVAMGNEVSVSGAGSVAVGSGSKVTGDNASAVGNSSVAGGAGASAIGHNAVASGDSSVALGENSVAADADVISVGHKATDTDANGNVYGSDLTRKITNVSSGTVAEGSTDVVTGGQLFETNQAIEDLRSSMGDVANLDLDGLVEEVGKGTVTDGDKNLVTGNTLYNEVRPVSDGRFVKSDNTVAENMVILDRIVSEGTRGVSYVGVNAVEDDQDTLFGGATGDYASTLGVGSKAEGDDSVAIGHGSNAKGVQSIAIGTGNEVTGNHSGAFGDPNTVSGDDSYVMGNNNTVSGNNSFVLSNHATVTGNNSVVLGNGSDGSMDNVVSVGSKGSERKVVHVARGEVAEGSTDAVTGGQLFDVQKDFREANGVDADKWAEKLGTGTVTDGDGNLVTGDTVYHALQDFQDSAGAVTSDVTNGEIHIGGSSRYDGVDRINVAASDGSSRVITGVATNPDDMTSAANVGYVNAVGQNIINGVNNEFTRVNDRINKVGAGAAAMAGLVPGSYEDGDKWSVSAAVGNYRNATAGAIGAFYKPAENITIALKGSFGNGENMVSGGIGVSLNKGNVPGVTKAQLVKTVNAQAAKIHEIEAEKAAQNHVIATQEQKIAELQSQMAQVVRMLSNKENSGK